MGNLTKPEGQVQVYTHPRLGNIKRIQEENKQQCMSFETVLENNKIYDEWQKQLIQLRRNPAISEILLLPLSHKFKETTYCGNGGVASVIFEDYLYSLYPEITNRRQIKRPFNEAQLMYLFYNLIKIESILAQSNKCIGDVKPENIVVNEDGYIKIISQYSWPGQTNKSLLPFDGVERIFLAPQDCEQRHKKKQHHGCSLLNKNQSETFSIALTILEAGTLKNTSIIYNNSNEFRFNEMKVKQLLDIFENRYSKNFYILVKEMLHPNPSRRWKAKDIYQILKPYEICILNMQEIEFGIDNYQYIPKIQRSQKISIKRLGESQAIMQGMQTAKFPSNNQQSRHLKNYNFYPKVHFNHVERNHPTYLQNHQFNLLNQNTHFQTQVYAYQPQMKNQLSNRERAQSDYRLVHSLPLNIVNYNRSQEMPQYITQQSMYQMKPNQQQNYYQKRRL